MKENEKNIQYLLKYKVLCNSIQQADYFMNLPIKPSNDFFFKLSQTSYNLARLELNIPDILFSSTGGNKWIKTSSNII